MNKAFTEDYPLARSNNRISPPFPRIGRISLLLFSFLISSPSLTTPKNLSYSVTSSSFGVVDLVDGFSLVFFQSLYSVHWINILTYSQAAARSYTSMYSLSNSFRIRTYNSYFSESVLQKRISSRNWATRWTWSALSMMQSSSMGLSSSGACTLGSAGHGIVGNTMFKQSR